MIVYAPTIVKVKIDQFTGQVANHPHAEALNLSIKSTVSGIESRLLDAIKFGETISKKRLEALVKGTETIMIPHSPTLANYCLQLKRDLVGKLSDGRLKHYEVISNKVKAYSPHILVSEIDLDWVNGFEKHLRDNGAGKNTVVSKISLLKRIIRLARINKLLKEDPFVYYTNPTKEKTLPTFLTEEEMGKFYNILHEISNENLVLSGYYFLLSCYAGYRMGDAKGFNADEKVIGNKIIIRAAKNGSIVSMPIHTRLKEILAYIKDKPLTITPEHLRKHVRQICSLIGVKRHIKFHSGRHSFAMLLMANGFTIDEVSELIGDTRIVTQTYARVHNDHLDKKIIERLG